MLDIFLNSRNKLFLQFKKNKQINQLKTIIIVSAYLGRTERRQLKKSNTQSSQIHGKQDTGESMHVFFKKRPNKLFTVFTEPRFSRASARWKKKKMTHSLRVLLCHCD